MIIFLIMIYILIYVQECLYSEEFCCWCLIFFFFGQNLDQLKSNAVYLERCWTNMQIWLPGSSLILWAFLLASKRPVMTLKGVLIWNNSHKTINGISSFLSFSQRTGCTANNAHVVNNWKANARRKFAAPPHQHIRPPDTNLGQELVIIFLHEPHSSPRINGSSPLHKELAE